MDAKPRSLKDIFDAQCRYLVPLYQRPYVRWTLYIFSLQIIERHNCCEIASQISLILHSYSEYIVVQGGLY